MLSLNEIKTFYPTSLHRFPRFLLREYLQVKILEIIFDQEVSDKLCFMGGTCLRLVHGNHRFSEDLDFDNRGLNKREFNNVMESIRQRLELEGYHVEFRVTYQNAWHCYIKFPGLLFAEGLSNLREEKILIQLDSELQGMEYEVERPILKRFEVFTSIFTPPRPILLAQKYLAILRRKRKQGRDFFDVVFLMGMSVQPDYIYLEQKAGIQNAQELKHEVLDVCQTEDMEYLARDVRPFIFPDQTMQQVSQFPKFIDQVL